jgi:hypothetical protein
MNYKTKAIKIPEFGFLLFDLFCLFSEMLTIEGKPELKI